MKQVAIYGLAIFGALSAATSASASPVTFFGQDQNPSVSTANSDAAHSSFLSSLSSSVRTEDFENLPAGKSAPLTLSFPGSADTITATLSGDGYASNKPHSGVFAISGHQFYETHSGGSFSLAFSSPISTFGFFGTDIGDLDATLLLTLTDTSGVDTSLQVTKTPQLRNGNQLFFGFIDTNTSYTNIGFGNDGRLDGFGFDDMIIADAGQVTDPPSNDVPAPGNLTLFGLSLFGLFLVYRRRRV